MWHLKRKYGPYTWTQTSNAFYRILKHVATHGKSILECGSSTGHISYRMAREGHDVTLLDIRAESIAEARKNFTAANLSSQFVVGSFLDHHVSYDLIWNSGLIQCFTADERKAFLQHAATLSPRLLLFYPDTNDGSGKVRGDDPEGLPGVGNSREYPVTDLPKCFCGYFAKVYWGRIAGSKLALPFDMYWLQGENPCASA